MNPQANPAPPRKWMRMIPNTRAAWVRLSILCAALLFTAWYCKVQVLYYYLLYPPREGDIVFQSLPHCDLVNAIEGVTGSPYSHCGVVLRDDGKWEVIESIGCVHETPLLDWMQRGRGAGIAVYRLKPQYADSIPRFKARLLAFTDYPYNYDYSMSDKAVYCSSLIYKSFLSATGEKMGTLQRLGDLNWQPYSELIKSMQANVVPVDRMMITPAGLSLAPQIQPVFRMGM